MQNQTTPLFGMIQAMTSIMPHDKAGDFERRQTVSTAKKTPGLLKRLRANR
tara:strand:- start:2842 stop:2994 length:153 start_codon:yes stop_codon:yes gene_type:complete